MEKTALALVLAVVAARCFAFEPPVRSDGEWSVAIPGFPESVYTNRTHGWTKVVNREVDARKPLGFQVVVSNLADRTKAGLLKVYLNDDWTVEGPQGRVELAAHEAKTFDYVATGRLGTVNALYPVHADFQPDGGGRALCPYAIFRTVNAVRTIPCWMRPDPGAARAPAAAETVRARRTRAVALAREALAKGEDRARGAYLLADGGGRFGAGVVRGDLGLVDGVIAFTDGARDLVYGGFKVEIDENDVGTYGAPVPFACDVDVKGGALLVRWSMPDVKRGKDGHPRFTRVNLAGCSEKVVRGYLGFGNVIENPGTFTCSAGGFSHNTRHVGADYANGLSLVHATDTIPQKPFVSNRDLNVFSTVTANDPTFCLVPGRSGAFEAARRFRAVCGYRKGPGHDAIMSRVCLDRWFCYDYDAIAADVRALARYGVTDCLYVKHDWRRWGWDFADPETDPLLPGTGSHAACVKACQEAGMLYVPHDNYIDVYPYADRYTYDEITFNLDNSPQVAFYNPGRRIQSYRWLPQKMTECARRNMRIIRESYAPDGLFFDVYTAHCPTDYLDRWGNYHTREEMSRNWGLTFRAALDELGKPAGPALSEAGQDHLIGVIDGGQSDHFDACRFIKSPGAFTDSELVPWHDVVSHGYFTLFAGGLEYRYAARKDFDKCVDVKNHGYGTDDYLSNTVIGGRNPQALGKFCRATVHTYWMLHDVCAALAKAELESVTFGPDIHRLHSTFSNGAEVWTNRRTNDTWTVAGVTLPKYGFLVRVPGGLECGVTVRDGVVTSHARAPGSFYADARDCGKLIDFGGLMTARSVRLECPAADGSGEWRLMPPQPVGYEFSVTLDLAAFGKSGAVVREAVTEDDGRPAVFRQTGDRVRVILPKRAFAVRLRFR